MNAAITVRESCILLLPSAHLFVRESRRRALAWRPVRQWREGAEGLRTARHPMAKKRSPKAGSSAQEGVRQEADTLRRASPRSPREQRSVTGDDAGGAAAKRRIALGEPSARERRKADQANGAEGTPDSSPSPCPLHLV